MEHLYINDLASHENKEISGFYLASEKELREGKGGQYLRLRLQDLSGSIAANVWKDGEKLSKEFDAGDVIHIVARVVNFKGQVQLSISTLRFADKSEYDFSLYQMKSKFPVDVLAERFWEYIDKVQNEYLNRLLHLIFDDRDFFNQYLAAPAAKSWHHNFTHGLIEHSIAVASLCEFCSSLYPISYDLVITGALLHDIGKVWEYTGISSIDFSDEGRLIGHLTLGDELISKTASRIPGFPASLLMNLRHLILSHHGEYEKASVRLPQSLEAVVLHLCDNLDAQSTGVAQIITAAPADSAWSEFDRLNNRYYHIFRG